METTVHRFALPICCRPGEYEEDHGLILLPESYTPDGPPTRLVINCHGAGGTVTCGDAQIEGKPQTRYLLANGYAVMDVNGLPAAFAEREGIDLRNNIGSPLAVESYVKAYEYCISRFNLKREVFVHGASMGGISSTNLVLSGRIPVIAQSGFCPVLDTYHQIFLHPWSKGLPKIALGKLYSLEQDEAGDYLYDEEKVRGYNPAQYPKPYPVPVKFWHCEDDHVVACSVTKAFVEEHRRRGAVAELVTFPKGGHEPQLVGEPLEEPFGNHVLQGEEIPIRPAVDQLLQWIKQHDHK